MNVSVLSASKSLFQGTATSVAFPGAQCAFTVLENHAPIISLLTKGIIVITNEKGEETRIDIAGGFVEIHANEVTACVELV